MRNLAKLIAVSILAALLLSCAGLTREQTNNWLSAKNGGPAIDMAGKWYAGGVTTGGWGEGDFIQEGKHFHGSLGMYYVDGVAAGEDVYMAISYGQKVYYTAHLKKLADGTITGKAVADMMIDRPEASGGVIYLISLKRTE